MIKTSNATCWFLTGSQGLYGPETLAQVRPFCRPGQSASGLTRRSAR
jgi:L-arabinose isomerase